MTERPPDAVLLMTYGSPGRIASLNDDPGLIEAIAAVARGTLETEGAAALA